MDYVANYYLNLIPVENGSNIQFQPRIVEYKESLQRDEKDIQATNRRPYRIVTCRPRLLLQHGDQLEDQERNVAQAKEHHEYSLDGTSMTLRVPTFESKNDIF